MTIPIIPAGSSADVSFSNIFNSIPFFMPTVLFFIYITIASAGYILQDRRTGMADIKAWLAVAGFVTGIITVITYLSTELINEPTMLISCGVTIGGVAWYLLSE
jgi:hypothetical protein